VVEDLPPRSNALGPNAKRAVPCGTLPRRVPDSLSARKAACSHETLEPPHETCSCFHQAVPNRSGTTAWRFLGTAPLAAAALTARSRRFAGRLGRARDPRPERAIEVSQGRKPLEIGPRNCLQALEGRHWSALVSPFQGSRVPRRWYQGLAPLANILCPFGASLGWRSSLTSSPLRASNKRRRAAAAYAQRYRSSTSMPCRSSSARNSSWNVRVR
jgi:hypothetical protein